MKILSIDPGYDRCGVALLTDTPTITVVSSSCIVTSKSDEHSRRLRTIYEELKEQIETSKPDAIALETLFFSVNKKTALKVAEARGALLLLVGLCEIPLIEVSPQEVKLSMTGVGNATKQQVEKMVRLTLHLGKESRLDDEIDAIALGVTALQKAKLESLKKGLAKKK